MRFLISSALTILWLALPAQGTWQHFKAPRSVSLRGVAALSADICWVSGASGSVFKTSNGGKTWHNISPSGFDTLDFRDIELFDERTALIMSAGYPTRVLRTDDGGISWTEVFSSDDERMFLDAMDFWNDQEGIMFGDAIGKDLVILRTSDQGRSWLAVHNDSIPEVSEHQGGFAASGTCLAVAGKNSAVIGLGGENTCILSSDDKGNSWKKSHSPVWGASSSSGIFSFSFLDSVKGVCAGGDYLGDTLGVTTMALTTDGGQTWSAIKDSAVDGRYFSCVYYMTADLIVGLSRFGSSWSVDGGMSWVRKPEAYYSISGFGTGFWASGPGGSIGRWLP